MLKALTALAAHVRRSRLERRVRQVEDFIAREQDMHAEQMLMLRTELARLRSQQASTLTCSTSGALP